MGSSTGNGLIALITTRMNIMLSEVLAGLHRQCLYGRLQALYNITNERGRGCIAASRAKRSFEILMSI